MFLTVLAFCVPGPGSTPILIAAGAAWLAAGLALALWLVFCGSNCGALLTAWQAFYFGAWLAAYLLGRRPAVAIIFPLLGAAATGLFLLWISQCKPSLCRIFFELVWVTMVPVALMLNWLGSLIPCGMLTGVDKIEAAIAAALAVAMTAACAKSKF